MTRRLLLLLALFTLALAQTQKPILVKVVVVAMFEHLTSLRPPSWATLTAIGGAVTQTVPLTHNYLEVIT